MLKVNKCLKKQVFFLFFVHGPCAHQRNKGKSKSNSLKKLHVRIGFGSWVSLFRELNSAPSVATAVQCLGVAVPVGLRQPGTRPFCLLAALEKQERESTQD